MSVHGSPNSSPKRGEDVIAFDMFERRDDFLSHVSDRITFVEGNILGFAHINEIVRNNPDLTGIVHTAALLGGDVRDNPHFATQVNVGGRTISSKLRDRLAG